MLHRTRGQQLQHHLETWWKCSPSGLGAALLLRSEASVLPSLTEFLSLGWPLDSLGNLQNRTKQTSNAKVLVPEF